MATFTIEQIACARDWIALQLIERAVIADRKTRTTFGGYNVTDGGEGGDASSGRHRSESHKEAIRRAHKGKTVSPETRRKIAEARKKQAPIEMTEAHRQAFMEGSKKTRFAPGHPPTKGWTGLSHTPEQRAAVSESMKVARMKRWWSSHHRCERTLSLFDW